MAQVRTPFERNRPARGWSNVLINLLILVVLTLLWATVYLSRDNIAVLMWDSENSVTQEQWSSTLGTIGSSISLNGIISSSSQSTWYTHLLSLESSQIWLKSSSIMLDSYTGSIELIGTIEADQDGLWIVEVTQVTNGTIEWMEPDTMSWDDNTDDELTGDILSWSQDDDETQEQVSPTTQESNNTSNDWSSELIEDRSVTQFRINTGKTLAYEGNRGFDIIFPTQNIAYEASNIGTWLEYGNNLRCSVQTNVIVYKDQDLINESPSVQIYECTAKKGFALSSVKGYRIIPGDTDSKAFLVKVNDPAWVRFANNLEVRYGDETQATESSNVSDTSNNSTSTTNSDVSRSIE
jgi:hypothetical protein